MKIHYLTKLNRGVEAFGTSDSISVDEQLLGNVSAKQIAEHMHMMNGLIPVDVAETVINLLGDVAIHFMAQGFKVPLYDRSGQMLGAMYANLKLKDSISLADAQSINPNVTALTLDNISEFVKPENIVVRAKFETEEKFNERLRSEMEGIEKIDVKEVPYIARKTSQGGSTNQGGNTSGENTGGGNNGGDDNVLG